MIDVIILASGNSQRMGEDKMLLPIGDDICLTRLVEVFSTFSEINNIYLVMRNDMLELFSSISSNYKSKPLNFVIGGNTRTKSVSNALKHINSPYVLIHDGARPFVSHNLVSRIIKLMLEKSSAIPILPISDSLRQVNDSKIVAPVDRDTIFAVQTPQGFKTDLIKKAYNLANEGIFTDDSEIFRKYIHSPHTIAGEEKNKKLTTIGDYLNINARVGYGFDAHALEDGLPFILGGVNIPHNRGMVAHSDGDVLIHSIIDAIFSAIGESDIGQHFSDTDTEYKDINSGVLLQKTIEIVKNLNYKILNISSSIMAQKPKLNPYISQMKINISKIMNISIDKIGICVTTTEKLGIIGEEKGIAVSTMVSVI